mmetsp:Transcript_17808/g.67612  ORF Transcript_17808/g.67612 Transcript_17808/m.67612 type:complete len:227 (-) Transcript_17808:669-1349(-)|eukprot:scaffold347_cov239-Pinguiococcus_pyrenoidosus.AAC.7
MTHRPPPCAPRGPSVARPAHVYTPQLSVQDCISCPLHKSRVAARAAGASARGAWSSAAGAAASTAPWSASLGVARSSARWDCYSSLKMPPWAPSTAPPADLARTMSVASSPAPLAACAPGACQTPPRYAPSGLAGPSHQRAARPCASPQGCTRGTTCRSACCISDLTRPLESGKIYFEYTGTSAAGYGSSTRSRSLSQLSASGGKGGCSPVSSHNGSRPRRPEREN